jgi:hypothetical protein
VWLHGESGRGVVTGFRAVVSGNLTIVIVSRDLRVASLQGLSMNEGNLYAIGTIKEDYLGPTEN